MNRGPVARKISISREVHRALRLLVRRQRDYLVERGIDPARLTVVGHGELMPIANNGEKAGRAANRRVDFKITSR